jgi:hypothetical protein
MARRAGYGREIVHALIRGEVGANVRAIQFLESSLTDAALDGCHHCGECETGEPCSWCGLKTEGTPATRTA